MKDIQCIGYGKQYHQLTLEIFNKKRRLYEIVKIEIMLKELQEKGMYAHRWNKPTKKGSNVTYKSVKTSDEYAQRLQEIKDYVEKVNTELGYSFEINTENFFCPISLTTKLQFCSIAKTK